MSRIAVRSYEEVEERRKETMTGVKKRSALDDVILLLFIIFAVVAVYFLVVSWAGFLPVDYLRDEAAAGVAALILLVHRLRSYHRNHSALGAIAFAFGDVVVFVGVLAAAAWVFVFPVIHPLPSETVAIGVVSLILISAMVMVFRFVQPITRTVQPDRDYSDIESSIRKLEAAVTHLTGRLPQGESRSDSATLDRLSSMMSELEAMRKEFATIRSSVPPPGSRPSTVVYSPGGVRAAPDFKGSSSEQVIVARSGGAQPGSPVMGQTPGVPDSTINNPWLDVLNKRRAKQPQAKPPEPSEPPP